MQESQLNKHAQRCLQKLLRIWFDFERKLNHVPILERLERGAFTQEDYLSMLLNLRQQVIEGSRWITRCASSFDRDFSDVRSSVIGHARDEHRDYEMLEQDYVRTGGTLHDIQSAERNAGTEALHAFLMYRASQKNPYDLLGAMWIIEGLGEKMAKSWAQSITERLGQDHCSVDFLRYHSENDDAHMQKLHTLLDRLCTEEHHIVTICRTATVVSKLYLMQLEEIDEK